MKVKERKNNCHTERKDFIRLYQKIGWINFNELWANDSTLNEGANSEQIGWKGLHSLHNDTIKFTMAGTQE